jgi:shikimate kinase
VTQSSHDLFISLFPSSSGIVVHRLKTQNDELFKDLDQKSKRVSQLESEKASLIRELFEARSKMAPKTAHLDHHDGHPFSHGDDQDTDNTFM